MEVRPQHPGLEHDPGAPTCSASARPLRRTPEPGPAGASPVRPTSRSDAGEAALHNGGVGRGERRGAAVEPRDVLAARGGVDKSKDLDFSSAYFGRQSFSLFLVLALSTPCVPKRRHACRFLLKRPRAC